MDGDEQIDMVMISHEAMWVYDLSSGEKKMQTTWGLQIRTYWAATAAMPLAAGELPSLLMINPMIPGVQVVTQDGDTSRSKWKLYTLTPSLEEKKSLGKIGGGFRVVNNSSSS